MPRESKIKQKARAARLATGLERLYPDARCTLDFKDPYELWAATVLSAQSTDERVNLVTPALFAAAPDAAAMATMSLSRLESIIRSIGLFRSKAKHLKAAAGLIMERHGGEVPAGMAELVALPGVGRKTANVILGNAHGQPGFPVDTHVGRLSRRLGLSVEEDPRKVEEDLTALFAAERWTKLSHQLIRHGREVCASRRPLCADCSLREDCPSAGRI